MFIQLELEDRFNHFLINELFLAFVVWLYQGIDFISSHFPLTLKNLHLKSNITIFIVTITTALSPFLLFLTLYQNFKFFNNDLTVILIEDFIYNFSPDTLLQTNVTTHYSICHFVDFHLFLVGIFLLQYVLNRLIYTFLGVMLNKPKFFIALVLEYLPEQSNFMIFCLILSNRAQNSSGPI